VLTLPVVSFASSLLETEKKRKEKERERKANKKQKVTYTQHFQCES
jgi:hypothetical protein